MGVDYNAFLGIGKRFNSKQKAVEFLQEFAKLDDGQIEDMLDGGYALPTFLQLKCLDCYNGDDWFVGFPANSDAPDVLSDDVASSAEIWDALFPQTECRVVLTVVYS